MRITIVDLNKTYKHTKALDSINLTIQDGMFGLLGQNGAGKTTLMRIMVTLLKQDSGEIMFNDISVRNMKEIRKIVGFLPQEFSLYPNFTVYDSLDYIALLSSIKSSAQRKKIIFELAEKVNITDFLQVKVRTLSGGMKRRLGIAQALINDPEVLIVDEPTAGLDPEERIRFRNMLSEFAIKRNVILSTHIVSDVEFTCENLSILKLGKIIYQGTKDDLIQKAQGYVWQVYLSKKEWEKVKSNEVFATCIIQSIIQDKENVKLRIISQNKPVINAIHEDVNLEDAYMYLIKYL